MTERLSKIGTLIAIAVGAVTLVSFATSSVIYITELRGEISDSEEEIKSLERRIFSLEQKNYSIDSLATAILFQENDSIIEEIFRRTEERIVSEVTALIMDRYGNSITSEFKIIDADGAVREVALDARIRNILHNTHLLTVNRVIEDIDYTPIVNATIDRARSEISSYVLTDQVVEQIARKFLQDYASYVYPQIDTVVLAETLDIEILKRRLESQGADK